MELFRIFSLNSAEELPQCPILYTFSSKACILPLSAADTFVFSSIYGLYAVF